jgi:uncharacterized repeat protein (TIGR01451 family)
MVSLLLILAMTVASSSQAQESDTALLVSTDRAEVGDAAARIAIDKLPNTQTVVEGTAAAFTIVVTNTGDETLNNVTVADALVPDCARTLGTLAAGESRSYGCALSQAAADFTNSATATGTPPTGSDVSDTDTAQVNVVSPNFEISKTPDMQTVASGDTASFTIEVVNRGDVALEDVTVSDPEVPDCNTSVGSLGIGQTATHTCQRTGITDGFINSATANGRSVAGGIVTTADAAHIRLDDTLSCPTDMLAYWKLDETTGSVFDDFYTGHDGVCAGQCPLPVAGHINGAQKFAATGTGISIPAIPGNNSFNWGLGDGFSLEFWMRTEESSTCAGNQVMVGRDDPATDLHWWAGCWNGGQAGFSLIDTGGTGYSVRGTTDLTDGEWHHVVVVRDHGASTIRVHVDGSQEGATSTTYGAGFDSSTAALTIGWLDLSSGFHFDGAVDELAVYNQALTEPEIRQRYDEGAAGRWYCEAGAYEPTIVSTPKTQTVSGELYQYDVDAAGEPAPAYTLLTYPAGMTIDRSTGMISWMPTAAQEGQYQVTVEARNSLGADEQTYTLRVISGLYCPDDIIAYWKLDEADGTSGYDDAFDGHDGVCAANCPVSLAGQIDGAQAFNGQDMGIDAPADVAFDWGADDSFTIEFWMSKGSTIAGNQVIVGRDDKPASLLHWWVGLQNVGGQGRAGFTVIDTGGAANSIRGTTDLTDGNWHHVAAVHDGAGNQLRLYVDGQLQAWTSASYVSGFDSATATVSLGWLNRAGSSGYPYEGVLDEVAIYGRALSVAEIQAHYAQNGNGPGYCTSPRIAVEKDADRSMVYAGDQVTYDYSVTNPGDVSLSNVNVSDDKCRSVTATGGDDNTNGKLDPGEIWSYTCSMSLSADTTNTVTASGTHPNGGTAEGTDTFFVDVINPRIEVSKTANPTTIYAGETVTYTYDVSNTGDDPLTNVSVSDNKCSPVTLVSGDVNSDSLLEVGENWTYICITTLSSSTTNTATAVGRDSIGNTVDDTATASVDVIGPQLALDKVAESDTILTGMTATYRYFVTNPGTGSLSNITVSDDKCAPVSYQGGDSNGDRKLDPGETWTYRCSMKLDQDTTNTATATGKDPLGVTLEAQDTAFVRVRDVILIYLPMVLR